MNTLLAIALTILYGVYADLQCQSGTIQLYEDMSYTIYESDNAAVCNIFTTEDSIQYWEIVVYPNGSFRASTVYYTVGYPFPESVLTINRYGNTSEYLKPIWD